MRNFFAASPFSPRVNAPSVTRISPPVPVGVSVRVLLLPVLFVTVYSADRLARSGAVGVHDRVLEKPYSLQELARTIRQMIEAHAARVAASAS